MGWDSLAFVLHGGQQLEGLAERQTLFQYVEPAAVTAK
jgi:hypothetical protein